MAVIALPAMHAKGHDTNCQVHFDTRRIPGTGTQDFEGHERNNSLLNKGKFV